jgi:hypothetical protein
MLFGKCNIFLKRISVGNEVTEVAYKIFVVRLRGRGAGTHSSIPAQENKLMSSSKLPERTWSVSSLKFHG